MIFEIPALLHRLEDVPQHGQKNNKCPCKHHHTYIICVRVLRKQYTPEHQRHKQEDKFRNIAADASFTPKLKHKYTAENLAQADYNRVGAVARLEG